MFVLYSAASAAVPACRPDPALFESPLSIFCDGTARGVFASTASAATPHASACRTHHKPVPPSPSLSTHSPSQRLSACPRPRTQMKLSTIAIVLAACIVSPVAADDSDAPELKKIHLVYMTHLDLGFTDTTRNVCDRYFDLFFPAAWKLSEELRSQCTDPSTCPVFQWTEFPWLIQEYLDGATGCSHRRRTPGEIAAMETAIENDDIRWHANPGKIIIRGGEGSREEMHDKVCVESSHSMLYQGCCWMSNVFISVSTHTPPRARGNA